MEKQFSDAAHWIADVCGRPYAFAAAALLVIVWACLGPAFDFGSGWQLFINTGTTIVTFLLVFLIQHTQNRDTIAMHAKLDELLRAVEPADNNLRHIETLSPAEIEALRARVDRDTDWTPEPRGV